MGKPIPDSHWIPEPNSGCFIWLGRIGGRGYGAYGDHAAHRVMYEQEKSKIPPGLVLDHLCRNILCINPDHLEPVTNKENILRGVGVGAINSKKTHCRNGHLLDEANTRVQFRSGTVRRACKTCQRESLRKFRRNRALSEGEQT